jgi:hypothetical protein
MAIKRSFILSTGIGVSADNLFVVNNTNSVSSTTGSIVLSGGIGIGQSASISGRLQMFNGANYTSFVSSASGNTVYTLPATSPATGSSVLQSTSAGVLSWVPMTATGGAASGNTAQNIVVNNAGNASAFHPILFTPSPLSAGSAVSSDGTISFNPSTEILNVSGLAITNTTASTSTSNGALQVAGGVGISGRLSFNQASFGTTGIATNPTMAMIGQTGDPIFMTVLEDNSIAFEGAQGQLFSITPNLSTGYIYSVNDITGIPLIRANANANVTANEYAGNFGIGLTNPGYKLHVLGSVGFTSTTASTSTTTGTLVVSGGVGIGGSIFGGSTISAADNIEIRSGKELRLNNSGNTFYTGIKAGANVSNTTYTFPTAFPGAGTSVLQSDTSGTLSWTGIVGFATTSTNINVVSATTSASHPVLFTPATGTASGAAVSTEPTFVYNPSTDILSVSGLAITSGTASTSSTTGALIVTGGVGIGGSLHVGTSRNTLYTVTPIAGFAASIPSTASVEILNSNSLGYTRLNLTNNNGNYVSFSLNGSGVANPNRAAIESSANLLIAAETNILHISTSGEHIFDSGGYCLRIGGSGVSVLLTEPSTSSSTGALTVAGGAGIAKTSYFGQSVFIQGTTASGSTTTGALVVSGGAGIAGSVSVGGRLQLFNGANYTAFVSSASGNTVYTLPATSPATGSSVLQSTSAGVMSWVAMTSSSSGNTAQNIVVNTAGNANVFHPVLFTPSSLSAGSAVSSDSTISFNPSTEILNVSGLAITSGTASTNTTTGALVVRGGLGVTGQLSFAQASFGFTGITTNPTMSFIGVTTSSPITLTVLTDNSLNFEGSQGSVFSIDSNLSSGEIFSVSDISGLPIISASAGQTVNINEFGGFTQIGNGSINSSSTTNGSLVVAGGMGVTGNANIGGTVRITNTTASTTSSSGALTVSGGVGIGLSASIGGRLQLFNGANYTALVSSATGNTVYTLPATSPATGTSVLVSTSAGVWSWASPTSVGNTSSGTTDGTVQYKSGSGFAGTNSFFYDTTLYALRLSNFPAGESTTSTSAALKVEQTTGSFNGSVNGTMIAVNANNGFTGDLLNLQTNAITKFRVDANGAIGMSSSLTTAGDLSITSITQATNTTSGALQVRGGLGITGNAFIGGTTSITNTTASVSSSSGALVVSGGVGIGQTLFVGGNILNTNYFYSGGNNFTKSGQAQGDIFLDNNSNDTPGLLYYYRNNTNFGIDAYAVGIGATRLRIVRDLNESTGAEIWSIDRTGVVNRSAWGVGEIIKMTVLVGADLTGGSTTTISTTSDTDVASYSYTPVSSNSYLVIEFTTRYFVVGAAADDYVSRIAVDGAEQSYNVQVWTNGAGGGTRSGTLFPLMARYTNSNTTAKTISATVRKGTTDDNATVYKDTTTVMKITEIGR